MLIGLIRSPRSSEARVGLIPAQVATLTRAGLGVLVQSGAGQAAGYRDEAYQNAGARIVYERLEALARPDVVLCPDRPLASELAQMRPGARLLALVHRHGGARSWFDAAREAEVEVIALEEVRNTSGPPPIRRRFAQVAGALCPQIAGALLQSDAPGGHGTLLGPIPGFPSAEVAVVGAGALGCAAAKAFAGLGCQVTVLDVDQDALERAETACGPIVTRLGVPANLRHVLTYADVLVLCASLPNLAAPRIISEEDVACMTPGSVLMDLAIDQGGNSATSRPIQHPRESWQHQGVVHFAMPNLPTLVARTSSKVFSATVAPWLLALGAGDPTVLSQLRAARIDTPPEDPR